MKMKIIFDSKGDRSMDFLNDIADFAKKVSDGVVEVTGELVSQGKEKVEKASNNQHLRNAYRKLGKIQYCAEKGLEYSEEQKKAVIDEIDTILANLKDLETVPE